MFGFGDICSARDKVTVAERMVVLGCGEFKYLSSLGDSRSTEGCIPSFEHHTNSSKGGGRTYNLGIIHCDNNVEDIKTSNTSIQPGRHQFKPTD